MEDQFLHCILFAKQIGWNKSRAIWTHHVVNIDLIQFVFLFCYFLFLNSRDFLEVCALFTDVHKCYFWDIKSNILKKNTDHSHTVFDWFQEFLVFFLLFGFGMVIFPEPRFCHRCYNDSPFKKLIGAHDTKTHTLSPVALPM